MATMRYMVDEEAAVRETIKAMPLPEGVRFKSVKPDHDWEGDPTWTVVFSIQKQRTYPQPFLRSLTMLSFEVAEEVAKLGFGKFPHSDFEEADPL